MPSCSSWFGPFYAVLTSSTALRLVLVRSTAPCSSPQRASSLPGWIQGAGRRWRRSCCRRRRSFGWRCCFHAGGCSFRLDRSDVARAGRFDHGSFSCSVAFLGLYASSGSFARWRRPRSDRASVLSAVRCWLADAFSSSGCLRVFTPFGDADCSLPCSTPMGLRFAVVGLLAAALDDVACFSGHLFDSALLRCSFHAFVRVRFSSC